MSIQDMIAQTLLAHPGVTDEDPAPELLCDCGATFDYLTSDEFYDATTWRANFSDEAEKAAFAKVDAELAAHQAQAVTEALGLVQEWGVVYAFAVRGQRGEGARTSTSQSRAQEEADSMNAGHEAGMPREFTVSDARPATRYTTPWEEGLDG